MRTRTTPMATPHSAVLLLLLLLLLLHATAATATPLRPMQASGDGAAVASLPGDELAAVFDVLGGLLGDDSWAELHPRPCADTPWPGLQCELGPDGRLHAARLHVGPDVAAPPCKPRARLSAALLRLPYLKTLSLFGCFQDPHQEALLPPALFTNASALEQLVLSSNPGLTGLIPATLSRVAGLRVLSLSQNGLRGQIPPELGRLTALQQLDLSYNAITGDVPPELGGMGSLTILDLSHNALTGGLPVSLGSLRRLQKVDLSGNHLTGRVPPEVGQLQELVLLDLSGNSLTGPLPATLAGLGRLQYLLLQDNPIGTPLPGLIGSLRRLQVLGLSGCNLTGPMPQSLFSSLANLTAVALDRNSLNGSIPGSLGALPHLGQLNLSQNRLTGEIELSSEFVTRLGKRLDLRENGELCIGRGRYGDLSSYLEAPPCVGGNWRGSSNRTWGQESSGTGAVLRLSSSSSWWVRLFVVFFLAM